MHWILHLAQQYDVQLISYLIPCYCKPTHTHTKAFISCRHHSLGREELPKKIKQQKIQRNQSLHSQHDGALSADWGHITKVSSHIATHSLLCQGNLRQCSHRIDPVSVHCIPIENSVLHSLMGQTGKENIIHPLVWYGIYVECYLQDDPGLSHRGRIWGVSLSALHELKLFGLPLPQMRLKGTLWGTLQPSQCPILPVRLLPPSTVNGPMKTPQWQHISECAI